MINLIQNSIKFSRPGSTVNVTIDSFQVDDPTNHLGVNIRVTDTGIGISPDDRQNLFKIFFKTSDETSRRKNQGSHGIGLNICKRFATNLGGDLIFNEEVTKGC